ncbi:outer membrane protein assembly factor BamB family protein [Natrinema salaciae]|uniref:outer membrane protein assembly factor BamB family protein n=1 Tax=Natrinema salaciae TaxID=1186196 RepID=UPI001587E530|nr:PQQ-binding-like beta-propeller repeat protein [Natrinema salaciae]
MGNTASVPMASGPAPPVTVAWEYEHGGRFAVVDGTVYLVAADGRIHALDAIDGSPEWTSGIGSDGEATASGSPAVANDTVYVNGDRMSPSLTALDAATGDIRWQKTDLGYETNLSPTVASGLVFSIVDTVLYALDADSGEKQWEFEPEPVTFDGREFGDRLSRRPVAVADSAVFAVANKQLFARDVETGDERWTNVLQDDWATEVFSGSPLATDGVVAAVKADTATFFDAATGEELSTLPTYSLDVLTDARAYAVAETDSDDGTVRLVGYDRETGDSAWESAERAASFGAPVVDDGSVYATVEKSSGESGVVAFDNVDGSREWSVATDGQPSRIAVADETLYASADGTLLAIRSEDATMSDEADADNEDEPEGTPGFTVGVGIASGALSLEWLRRRTAADESAN